MLASRGRVYYGKVGREYSERAVSVNVSFIMHRYSSLRQGIGRDRAKLKRKNGKAERSSPSAFP